MKSRKTCYAQHKLLFVVFIRLLRIHSKNNLIISFADILAQCHVYKKKLIPQTQTPPPPEPSESVVTLRNNDAVGSLITFCQHHGFKPPMYALYSNCSCLFFCPY